MNARACKAKGREGENGVVEYLREHGFPAERRRLTGVDDCGDVGGIDGLVVEVKNEKRINLAGYMDELESEVKNARCRFGREEMLGVCVVKRRGTQNPGDWYAVMRLERFVELLGGWEIKP